MPFDGTEYRDPIRDLLRLGRARIAAGWCQNALTQPRSWWRIWEPKTQYCMLGAINENEDAIVPLLHAIGVPFGTSEDIEEWNDDPERTRDEVLAAFDRALE